MLIHVVCLKYKSEVNEATREEHRARLKALSQLDAAPARLDVGADILHLDRSFDTALVAEFESRAALDAYTVHPEHQAVLAFTREIVENVVSVDFWA